MGKSRVLFDVHKDGSKMAPKWVAPESEQDEYESRRLWLDLTKAIANKDMEAATTAKSAVENAQRELRTKREASGESYTPRFFELKGDHYEPKFKWVLRLLLIHQLRY